MSASRNEKAPTLQCTGLDHLNISNHEHPSIRIDFRRTRTRCQCAACSEFFNSVSVFDLHRVGSWHGYRSTRRCLTTVEMKSRGWSLSARGFWIQRKRRDLPRRIDDQVMGAGLVAGQIHHGA